MDWCKNGWKICLDESWTIFVFKLTNGWTNVEYRLKKGKIAVKKMYGLRLKNGWIEVKRGWKMVKMMLQMLNWSWNKWLVWSWKMVDLRLKWLDWGSIWF